MRRAAAIAATAVICGLSSCRGGGATPTPHPVVPGSGAPSTVPTTTTTTLDLIPQVTPDVAAVALLRAWSSGDQVAASHVATPAAIATLFAQQPQAFSDRGCQEPLGGISSCAFGIGAGLLSIHTVTLAGGWLVDRVTFE